MKPWELVRVAFEALRVNRMRSLLTMLGVIIGVWAVVVLVAIGSGAKSLVQGEIAANQTDAAADVVADTARGNDALVDVEGGDTADGEAVAPVDVRHGVRGAHDARQTGDVLDLLEGVVEFARLDHAAAGEDPSRHAHRRLAVDLPLEGSDLAHVRRWARGK